MCLNGNPPLPHVGGLRRFIRQLVGQASSLSFCTADRLEAHVGQASCLSFCTADRLEAYPTCDRHLACHSALSTGWKPIPRGTGILPVILHCRQAGSLSHG